MSTCPQNEKIGEFLVISARLGHTFPDDSWAHFRYIQPNLELKIFLNFKLDYNCQTDTNVKIFCTKQPINFILYNKLVFTSFKLIIQKMD